MDSEIVIATRVSRPVHAKIKRRQRAIRAATGITPSVSAVVRLILEEALDATSRSRRRSRVTPSVAQ